MFKSWGFVAAVTRWTLLQAFSNAALTLEGLIKPPRVIEPSNPIVGVIYSITAERSQSFINCENCEAIPKLLSQSEQAQAALAKAKSRNSECVGSMQLIVRRTIRLCLPQRSAMTLNKEPALLSVDEPLYEVLQLVIKF